MKDAPPEWRAPAPLNGVQKVPFPRLDRSAKRGVERPCLHDKPLIVEARSLHSASLRSAPVETTGEIRGRKCRTCERDRLDVPEQCCGVCLPTLSDEDRRCSPIFPSSCAKRRISCPLPAAMRSLRLRSGQAFASLRMTMLDTPGRRLKFQPPVFPPDPRKPRKSPQSSSVASLRRIRGAARLRQAKAISSTSVPAMVSTR